MQEFVYERPRTVEEAVAAMRGDDARALAGGTQSLSASKVEAYAWRYHGPFSTLP